MVMTAMFARGPVFPIDTRAPSPEASTKPSKLRSTIVSRSWMMPVEAPSMPRMVKTESSVGTMETASRLPPVREDTMQPLWSAWRYSFCLLIIMTTSPYCTPSASRRPVSCPGRPTVYFSVAVTYGTVERMPLGVPVRKPNSDLKPPLPPLGDTILIWSSPPLKPPVRRRPPSEQRMYSLYTSMSVIVSPYLRGTAALALAAGLAASSWVMPLVAALAEENATAATATTAMRLITPSATASFLEEPAGADSTAACLRGVPYAIGVGRRGCSRTPH